MNYATGIVLVLMAVFIGLGCAWLITSIGAARDHRR